MEGKIVFKTGWRGFWRLFGCCFAQSFSMMVLFTSLVISQAASADGGPANSSTPSEQQSRTSLVVTIPISDAKVFVDGIRVSLDRIVPLQPGKHLVEIESDTCYPVRDELMLSEGEQRIFSPRMKIRPDGSRQSMSSRWWYKPTLTVIGGGAVAIVGLGLFSTTIPPPFAESKWDYNTSRKLQTTSFAIISTGGAILLGGTIWLISAGIQKEPKEMKGDGKKMLFPIVDERSVGMTYLLTW